MKIEVMRPSKKHPGDVMLETYELPEGSIPDRVIVWETKVLGFINQNGREVQVDAYLVDTEDPLIILG